jgi:histidinol-phosphate phosphatase family protein
MQDINLTHLKEWSLFLDRDGVLNVKLDHDYVKSVQEFIWLENVPQTIASLTKIFKHIIVVTNQQGIGKGLMTNNDLQLIHSKLKEDVRLAGGKIHGIFYAPQLAAENHPDRKPGIGMLLKAKTLFPDIDFEKSIMVGDSLTDMVMADRAGMKKVFINQSGNSIPADFTCSSLPEFYQCLIEGRLKFL